MLLSYNTIGYIDFFVLTMLIFSIKNLKDRPFLIKHII